MWFKNRRAKHRKQKRHDDPKLLVSQPCNQSLPQQFLQNVANKLCSREVSYPHFLNYPLDLQPPRQPPYLIPKSRFNAVEENGNIWSGACYSDFVVGRRETNENEQYCFSIQRRVKSVPTFYH